MFISFSSNGSPAPPAGTHVPIRCPRRPQRVPPLGPAAAAWLAASAQVLRGRGRTSRSSSSVTSSGLDSEVSPPGNFYELFGFVSGEAVSTEEIQRRRRALLKVCHPDVAGDGGAAITTFASEAAEVLSDPESRAAYDRLLRQQGRGNNSTEVPGFKWPSLKQIQFSEDTAWPDVAEEERGPHHLGQERLFVDEVACTGCRLCTDIAPETFEMVQLPHDETRGFGFAARVKKQWGDGEQSLQDSLECCPGRCIYWVPRGAVRTLEYVAQAEEYEPYSGSRRKGRPFLSNLDPLTGKQVFSPFVDGMSLWTTGRTCPEDIAKAPETSSVKADERLVAAWIDLPVEVRLRAAEAVSRR